MDPLSMEFSRQEYWSGLPCSPPGDLLDPGIKPTSLNSPALAGGFCHLGITQVDSTTSTSWGTQALSVQFSSVQSLSRVRLFVTPWITARQASLSITNSRSLLKPVPIESVMPSSHLILCRPLRPLPPIPPSIRVFSNETTLHMRCPKDWSFSFSISPSNEHPGLISFRMGWLDLLAVQGDSQESSPTPQFKSINFLQSKGLSRVFSNTTVQKHQFFGAQLSSSSTLSSLQIIQ